MARSQSDRNLKKDPVNLSKSQRKQLERQTRGGGKAAKDNKKK